jgi:hypothetical protein
MTLTPNWRITDLTHSLSDGFVSNGWYADPVDGEIRVVRLYNRALSASEITSNMNA